MAALDVITQKQAGTATTAPTTTVTPTTSTPQQQTLRDYAKNQGYTISYDDKTQNINILNPNTNKSVTFKSGEGSQYGMGGLSNGSNVISDPSKLAGALNLSNSASATPAQQSNSYLNGIEDNSVVKQTRQDELNSMYENMKQSQLTNALMQRQQSELGYNQSKGDTELTYQAALAKLQQEKELAQPQYQNMKNQQFKTTLNDIQKINENRANMGQYFGGANAQVQSDQRVANESAMNTISLQEQQLYDDINKRATEAYNQKTNDIKKIDEQLGLLRSQGSMADNSIVQALEAQKMQSTLDLNNILDERSFKIADIKQQYEQNQQQNAFSKASVTGTYVSPEQQQVMNEGVPQSERERINAIASKMNGGYQAYMNQLDPNSVEYAYAAVLRNEKIAATPELQSKYKATQLGTQTQQAKEAASNKAIQMAGLTGNYISPEQQSIVDNGVSPADTARINAIVAKTSGGYQSYINQLDPTSDEYVKATLLRNAKISSSPELLQKYGLTKVGTETLAAKTEKLQQEGLTADIYAKQTENKYLNQKIQTELKGADLENAGKSIANQISQLNLDYLPQEKQLAIQSAQQDYAKGNLDMAYQKIVNANLPAKLEAELNGIYASTENTYANISGTNVDTELKMNASSGGSNFKYTAADVTSKAQDYIRTYGTFDKVSGKYVIKDGKKQGGTGVYNGIPDNQGEILSAMGKEYSQNGGGDGYYNMLKSTAQKMGISNSDFAKAIAKTSGTSGSGASIVSSAKNFTGTPYVWGGNTSKGIDCSGLTQQAYKSIGINLPRTTTEQVKQGKAVSKSDLQPGDLIFFNTSGKNSHVGIYAGNGMMTHAGSKGVATVKMDTDYWNSRYSTSRRIS